ncbi:MAG: AMP-binding protein, partial [Deltaproteobacteria bacterium]|nr:AMP-binding protein [Deltaproteobacteria bacterium]
MKREPLIHLIQGSLRRMDQKRALTFLRGREIETRLSFHDLDEDSDCMARSFKRMGLGQGDCAVLFLPKCVSWVVAHLAVLKIG